MNKIYLGITSVWNYAVYKLRYGKKLSFSPINSLKGKLSIIIDQEGFCGIGQFLMISGPLYLNVLRGAKLTIGDRVFFNHNCSITCTESISIGNACMIANNCVIVDHDHVIDDCGVSDRLTSSSVVIEDNVWIGANVTITKGVHIGTGAVIGANSVVLRDIEPYSVVAGVPAKVIKQ